MGLNPENRTKTAPKPEILLRMIVKIRLCDTNQENFEKYPLQKHHEGVSACLLGMLARLAFILGHGKLVQRV